MTLLRYLEEAPGSLIWGVACVLMLATLYFYIMRIASREMRTADRTAMQVEHVRKCMTAQNMEIPKPLYRKMPHKEGTMTVVVGMVWAMVGVYGVMLLVVLVVAVAGGVAAYPTAGIGGLLKSLGRYAIGFEPDVGCDMVSLVVGIVCAWKIIEPLKDAEIYAWQQKDELNRLTTLCHEAGISIDE
jgi:hypothetical protein